MMGLKARVTTPRHAVSLEDLVPADHFYRHLDRVLDLAFVRDLVRDTYAPVGRPSIDPVVFFRLQLVLFFEGLRSERQLLRMAADRLSVRWYLGYDLGEALPHHSSLTRIRGRYGLPVFRRFFEAVVEQCVRAKLVWGRELYFDATQVDAHASLDSAAPRFAVEAHLRTLFGAADVDAPDAPDASDAAGGGTPTPSGGPVALPVPGAPAARAALAAANAARHDWLARDGRPDRTVVHAYYRRRSDFEASRTDPDAALMARKGGGLAFGDHDHDAVDGGRARVILGVLVTPADVMENQPLLDLLWRVRFRWRLRPRQVTGDTTYGTVENIVALEEAGIRAYVPVRDFDQRTPFFPTSAFAYDAAHDRYVCPRGQALPRKTAVYRTRTIRYRAAAAACNACPLKARCTTGARGRIVTRSFDEAYLDRVRAYRQTPAYQKAMRKRSVWVEPLFGEAKDWHGLRRFRLRGLWKVNSEAHLIAAGQNLKRLLRRRGWGRRPWPGGPAAAPAATSARGALPRAGVARRGRGGSTRGAGPCWGRRAPAVSAASPYFNTLFGDRHRWGAGLLLEMARGTARAGCRLHGRTRSG
jgi:transposase